MNVTHGSELTTLHPREPHERDAALERPVAGFENVWAVATATNRDRKIAPAGVAFELKRECIGIADVVANSREHGQIVAHAKRAEATLASDHRSFDKISNHVARVCVATAVAKDMHARIALPAVIEGVSHALYRSLIDGRGSARHLSEVGRRASDHRTGHTEAYRQIHGAQSPIFNRYYDVLPVNSA